MTPVILQGDWLPYLVVCCATWRLTHLFMYEQGPWNTILKLRRHFGVRHDQDGHPLAWPEGSLFECFLCFSVWTAIVMVVLPWWVSVPFAASAIAIWAEAKYGKS